MKFKKMIYLAALTQLLFIGQSMAGKDKVEDFPIDTYATISVKEDVLLVQSPLSSMTTPKGLAIALFQGWSLCSDPAQHIAGEAVSYAWNAFQGVSYFTPTTREDFTNLISKALNKKRIQNLPFFSPLQEICASIGFQEPTEDFIADLAYSFSKYIVQKDKNNFYLKAGTEIACKGNTDQITFFLAKQKAKKDDGYKSYACYRYGGGTYFHPDPKFPEKGLYKAEFEAGFNHLYTLSAETGVRFLAPPTPAEEAIENTSDPSALQASLQKTHYLFSEEYWDSNFEQLPLVSDPLPEVEENDPMETEEKQKLAEERPLKRRKM